MSVFKIERRLGRHHFLEGANLADLSIALKADILVVIWIPLLPVNSMELVLRIKY